MRKNRKKQSAINDTIQTLYSHEIFLSGGVAGHVPSNAELISSLSHAVLILMQVENLIQQKGRHNTEIAYLGLVNRAEGKS